MLVILLLAVIALLVFGFATTLHWLIWLAIIAAVIWVIAYFFGNGVGRGRGLR